MPELLNDSIKEQIHKVFDHLKEPVQILVFTSQENCELCTETRQLAEEVAALSDKLGVSVFDLQADAGTARQYHVVHAPSLVLAAKDGETLTDRGVRFTGIPAGHEFTSLIQSLLIVSSRDSGLKPQTREFLQGLKEPIHLQVFVTPT